MKHNSSQDYFWTEEWQGGEREADEDIKNGRIKCFSTAREAIAELNSSVSDDYVWGIDDT